MNKDNNDSRQEFLDGLKKGKSFDDSIDRKAADGWKQVSEKPEDLMGRLDSRLDKKISKGLPWMKIMASLAAVFLVGFLVWKFSPASDESDSPDLYATYYESMPNTIPITRSGENSELLEAVRLYEDKKYSECISLFISYENSTEVTDVRVQFYLGMAFMETKQFELAALEFVRYLFSQDDSKELVNEANWYLALTYLKLEKKEEAIMKIKEISKDHYVYNQAQSLLKKLE